MCENPDRTYMEKSEDDGKAYCVREISGLRIYIKGTNSNPPGGEHK